MDDLKAMWAEVPAGTERDLAGARHRLLNGMRQPRRSRGKVRFAVAGGLAAALTVGFAAVQVTTDARPANAQELLARAAESAGSEPDLNPRPGQIVHTVGRDLYSSGARSGGSGGIEAEAREDWQPADGSREFMMRQGDQVTLMKLCSDSFIKTVGMTYADLSNWPTDVAALKERVRQVAAKHPAEPRLRETFTLQDLINMSAVRPSLRASLFKLISEMKGVSIQPSVTDALGRSGIGVQTPDRMVLIFEPETYRYLGYNSLDEQGRLVGGGAVEKVELLDRLPKEKVTFTEPKCIPA
ncbi:CU044_5270 family protein [Nonomuraea sp. NPDC050786]|uniref:CU044_5270 family protein n=1 Tax=Nonomuraea sp. NPDC050786 TaxID=3154840 RepID=UPI0033C7EE3F